MRRARKRCPCATSGLRSPTSAWPAATASRRGRRSRSCTPSPPSSRPRGAATAARELLEQCVALAPDCGGASPNLGCGPSRRRPRQRGTGASAAGDRPSAPHGAEVWDNLGLSLRRLGEDEQASARFRARRRRRARAHAGAGQPGVCALHAVRVGGPGGARSSGLRRRLDDAHSDPRWSPWIALAMPLTPAQQLVRRPALGGRGPAAGGAASRRARHAARGCASVICPATSASTRPGA